MDETKDNHNKTKHLMNHTNEELKQELNNDMFLFNFQLQK